MTWRLPQLLLLLPFLVLGEGVATRLASVVQDQTNEATRSARLKRQRELNDWFHEHDRRVLAPAECKTEQDRRNADEYHATMSNFQLLALPRRERRKAKAALQAYAQTMNLHGEAALRTLFSPLPPELLARWQEPPTIKAACLGGIVRYAPAAVYVPDSQTMYLDFNQAIEPALFADAFEHELWHHLVRCVAPPDVARNLFWEGYNETLSELWGAELRRQAGEEALADGPVRYPVSSAIASLCFAANRRATLAWLLGERESTDLAKGIAPTLPSLAALLSDRLAMPETRKAHIETILENWNWHEDDGTPPVIDSFLVGATIDPERIRTAFRLNRRYLEAFIAAQAVVWLQDLVEAEGRDKLQALASSELPDALAGNLGRAMNYVRNPAAPLR
jgi:hypothetical protein